MSRKDLLRICKDFDGWATPADYRPGRFIWGEHGLRPEKAGRYLAYFNGVVDVGVADDGTPCNALSRWNEAVYFTPIKIGVHSSWHYHKDA